MASENTLAADLCELAPRYICSIAPYQPGKPISELAREYDLDPDSIIKLASNENPLGVSPLGLAAMRDRVGYQKVMQNLLDAAAAAIAGAEGNTSH